MVNVEEDSTSDDEQQKGMTFSSYSVNAISNNKNLITVGIIIKDMNVDILPDSGSEASVIPID